jgi:hypothetical protein
MGYRSDPEFSTVLSTHLTELHPKFAGGHSPNLEFSTVLTYLELRSELAWTIMEHEDDVPVSPYQLNEWCARRSNDHRSSEL